MPLAESLHRRLNRVQRAAAIATIAGAIGCAAGFALDRTAFFQAYLMAFVYVVGLSLGALAMAMVHQLVGGAWGHIVRPILEACSWPLVWMLLLFLPLAIGLEDLYLWARPEVVEHDHLLQLKTPYLNRDFFVARAVGYFAIWSLLTYFFQRGSARQLAAGGTTNLRWLRGLSAAGLAIYVLTMTFAAVDWLMSLDPHWFSAIYGVLVIIGQCTSALAIAVLMLTACRDEPPYAGVLRPEHLRDLGNLLLALISLWMYMSVSQFLIIWSANIPEEITWYLQRSTPGWQLAAVGLVLLGFAVPFFSLLMMRIKTESRSLAWVAGLLVAVQFFQIVWLAAPSFERQGFVLHWLDPVAALAVGGLWTMAAVTVLKKTLARGVSPLAVLKKEQHD